MSDVEQSQWLSYAELADARGIDRLSAVRIARKRRWPKQKGNDGTIRVAVPRAFLDSKRRDPRDDPRDGPRDDPPEFIRKIAGLEAKIEALTERLAQETGRADATEKRIAELVEQLADLRVREGAALARAETLQGVVDRLTAWPGAGAWARLRRAWRR